MSEAASQAADRLRRHRLGRRLRERSLLGVAKRLPAVSVDSGTSRGPRKSGRGGGVSLPPIHGGGAAKNGGRGAEIEAVDDLEARWQAYLRSEEFHTFHAVVDCLQTLPPTGQLVDRRVDFELFIHLLHRLGQALGVEHVSKGYRAHYSPDVQLSGYLYSTLLTAFTLLPSYVLNGQEFHVSDTVLDQCRSLQYVFEETCRELRRQFENLQPYSLEHVRNDVRRSLAYFDRSWCRFEMPALEEIEAIHRQACRPLIEAIEVEQALTEAEGRASSATARAPAPPGAQRVRLEVQRHRLMEKICLLNRLANIDGRGRDDMNGSCITEAEKIVARPGGSGLSVVACSLAASGKPGLRLPAAAGAAPAARGGAAGVSPVLLRVARMLLRSLSRLRRVLHRYGRCLYQLNSHLANNPDLVRALENFESAWETADRYLVQAGPRRLALAAFEVISGIREPSFEASLRSLDPGFLVASLPRALLFHEMRRACSSGMPPSSGVGAMVKPLKAAEGGLPATGSDAAPGGAVSMLPRPGLEGAQHPTAPMTTALQRSPLSRAFLPPEVAATYNETADLLGRLSEARLARLHNQLVSQQNGSPIMTPMHRQSGTTPLLVPRSIGTSGGCGSAARASDRPPQTPCPPRMAVPNSSRPPTSLKTPAAAPAAGLPLGPNIALPPGPAAPAAAAPAQPEAAASNVQEEDSEEEEDALEINLAGLQDVAHQSSVESAFMPAVPPAAAPPSTTPSRRASMEGDVVSEDRIDVRQVISSISTLALHLQRAKPHEWNELIQVVLQGIMLASSSPPSAKA